MQEEISWRDLEIGWAGSFCLGRFQMSSGEFKFTNMIYSCDKVHMKLLYCYLVCWEILIPGRLALEGLEPIDDFGLSGANKSNR